MVVDSTDLAIFWKQANFILDIDSIQAHGMQGPRRCTLAAESTKMREA